MLVEIGGQSDEANDLASLDSTHCPPPADLGARTMVSDFTCRTQRA
jgi:hypothetical protein